MKNSNSNSTKPESMLTRKNCTINHLKYKQLNQEDLDGLDTKRQDDSCVKLLIVESNVGKDLTWKNESVRPKILTNGQHGGVNGETKEMQANNGVS